MFAARTGVAWCTSGSTRHKDRLLRGQRPPTDRTHDPVVRIESYDRRPDGRGKMEGPRGIRDEEVRHPDEGRVLQQRLSSDQRPDVRTAEAADAIDERTLRLQPDDDHTVSPLRQRRGKYAESLYRQLTR